MVDKYGCGSFPENTDMFILDNVINNMCHE